MTISDKDAALARRLDEYSPTLDAERQTMLLAAVEARLDAAALPFWRVVPPGQTALYTGAALGTLLIGIWAGGNAAQLFGAPLVVAGLLLGQGG